MRGHCSIEQKKEHQLKQAASSEASECPASNTSKGAQSVQSECVSVLSERVQAVRRFKIQNCVK